MFRRVCLMQCKILSAARCQTAASLWPSYHYHLSTTTATPEEEDTHTNNNKPPEPPPRTYDPATYRLPFNPTEGRVIMDILNAATPQHLTTLGVGKGMARRLLKHRERIGCFQDLSQLLEVDGVGMRGAEGMCMRLLQGCGSVGVEGVEGMSLLQSESLLASPDLLIRQKRLVKPRLTDDVLENMECFVALHVTAGFLAWVLCGADGQIRSLATHPLLTANTRFDTLRIYEKVLRVTREIPEADFYVWEDRASHSQLAKAHLATVIVALQLAQIRGMLMAILGGSVEEEEVWCRSQSRLLFLKDTVVPKLFRLKMGGDRFSGLGLVDQVMEGRQAVEWLPPITLDPEVQEAYFSEEPAERRYVAAAVLVAVAFREVLLSKNSGALKVLSQ